MNGLGRRKQVRLMGDVSWSGHPRASSDLLTVKQGEGAAGIQILLDD